MLNPYSDACLTAYCTPNNLLLLLYILFLILFILILILVLLLIPLSLSSIYLVKDQDGASAWTPLDQPQYVGRSLLRPVDSSAYEIASTFDLFKKLVLSQDGFDEIKKGDCVVHDIILWQMEG